MFNVDCTFDISSLLLGGCDPRTREPPQTHRSRQRHPRSAVEAVREIEDGARVAGPERVATAPSVERRAALSRAVRLERRAPPSNARARRALELARRVHRSAREEDGALGRQPSELDDARPKP